jgi:PAS domain S-box-containing protein
MPDHKNGNLPKNGGVRNGGPDFGRLVQSIRDYAIFLLDPVGQVLTWNEGAQAIKGYAPDEIIGSHFSRFYPWDRIESGWPQYELEMAAKDGRFEDENWRLRKDGSRFWANVVITALRDNDGTLTGFAKVTRDLSARRATEETLRQSEERFRMLIEGVRDYAIFTLDPNGLVTTWNAGAQTLKGYSADEVIGSHFSRFYPADELKRGWPEHELRMATTEGRFEDEGWRLRKDGSRFWANVVITALRDSAGTLKGFSKITRDLSERKEHERQLAESEERFRMLVQGVTDYAIVMLDQSGAISSWNSGAEKITGYTATEMLGKHVSNFYTSEDIRSNRPWQQLLTAHEKRRVSEEGWRVKKDGSQFWANTVITALEDPQGRERGYVHVMQDLTQRRHAESLADTTQRMHEFIAMLAHELRNPLAPIRNAVELMGKRGLQDETLESMRQMIHRQTNYLTRIIDELLDVNRIARGAFSVTKEAIDLSDVLRKAVETSRPLIDSQGHTLTVDIPEEPLIIQGDALRLTQAIVNLLNNAAHYSPRGGEVRIAIERRQTDVVIRVRDTGRGIDKEHLEIVFDLFARPNADVHEHHGGLGVGLALVRRVIELHAGTVRAYSAGVGQGSEFVVRLPLPLGRLQLVSNNTVPAKSSLERLRIVVADDNKDAADSLQALLQALGQDVYAVYDGPTALKAVESFSPHVVMLDIGMPRMSGYEVADAIRDTLGDKAPVLAAVTGWGQDTDKRLAATHGFAYHFTKPASAAALSDLIDNVGAQVDKAKSH